MRRTVESSSTPHHRPLTDVLEFMQLLWALVHALERTSKRMNRKFGVTGPQRLVLRVVGLMPGVSAGRLAAILHVHPSTLTGVLRRLVGQRMITRVAASGDRRRAMLYLAARGEQVNKLTEGTVEGEVRRALRTISPRDRAAAHRVLTLLADHLGETPRPRAARADARKTR